KAAVVEPAFGAVYARPSFLTPRGFPLHVNLSDKAIEQRFYLPADDIRSLEVSLATLSAGENSRGSVSLTLLRENGKKVATKEISFAAIGDGKICNLDLPALFGPKGGDAL